MALSFGEFHPRVINAQVKQNQTLHLSIILILICYAACEMVIHKTCAKKIEETCVGTRPRETKIPSFLRNIMPEERDRNRKSSHINVPQSK